MQMPQQILYLKVARIVKKKKKMMMTKIGTMTKTWG